MESANSDGGNGALKPTYIDGRMRKKSTRRVGEWAASRPALQPARAGDLICGHAASRSSGCVWETNDLDQC